MNSIIKNWLIILLLISLVAISSALIAEFFFNLMPCKMCLKQRYAYYAIIALLILFYFFRKYKNLWIVILIEFSILYGLFYSIWHVGIEKNILPGPSSCSGTLAKTNSIENLKAQITDQPIVNCSDIIWSIFGISAATINVLLLLFLLIFNSIFIFKYYYEKKEI